MSTDDIGAQLSGWGTVASVTTHGRVSGDDVVVAVGFVEEPSGSLLVAAGEPDADWALNLEVNPSCVISVGDRTWDAVAEMLNQGEAAQAVTGLILKYGTSSERLGLGPAFRLRAVGG